MIPVGSRRTGQADGEAGNLRTKRDRRSTCNRGEATGRAGKAGNAKSMNEPARDVYGGGNRASGVTNVESAVESSLRRGWSYATERRGNTQRD